MSYDAEALKVLAGVRTPNHTAPPGHIWVCRACGPMSSEERFNAMMEIASRAAQLPILDPRRPDEIIGYNALGLPE